MTIERQTSFAGGELSPLLWGRSDLPQYQLGLKTLKNFVVNRPGNAVTRAGFKLAWTAKADTVALVPFLHASKESYVLEFSHLAVRIYNARTFALVTELVTPFQSGDLQTLRWSQIGSSLIVTHPNRNPQEIYFATSPAIADVRTAPPGDTFGGAALHAIFPSIGGNPPAKPCLASWDATSIFTADADHAPREWRYKVSTIIENTLTGEQAETLPVDIDEFVVGDVLTGTVPSTPGSGLPLTSNQLILFDDQPIYIEPGVGSTAVDTATNWVPIANLYYRGRGELFGYVGRGGITERFADFGEEPDYTRPPLRGDAPWRAGEHPTAIAHFGQRRVFGGGTTEPQSTWMSEVDAFENFDKPIVPFNGQPLALRTVDERRETIQNLLGGNYLFLFTDTSAWVLGRKEVPLDFDTISSLVRCVSKVGSTSLRPLEVDGAVIFARAQGRGVRLVGMDGNGEWQGADASWTAEHLFRGISTQIVSWAHQREPHNAVWAVRQRGIVGFSTFKQDLLSVTRGPNGMWAWARHVTGETAANPSGDQVSSVCSVPASDTSAQFGDADLLFIAVSRGGARYIECMRPNAGYPIPRYPTDPKYEGNSIGSEQFTYPVDSFAIATITKATGTTVSGLSRLEGREVWAVCPGVEPDGPHVVTGGQITTNIEWGPTGATTFTAAIGLGYVCDLETLAPAGNRMDQKTVAMVAFEVDEAVGLKVGEDFEHLVTWKQRRVADSYESPTAASLIAEVRPKGSWRLYGRACLRQDLPQPCTVLGIARDYKTGGI